MKPSKKPTPREKKVLLIIIMFYNMFGEMPTFQELANMMNRSRTTIFEQVGYLVKKGYLTSQGTIRGLEFTGKEL